MVRWNVLKSVAVVTVLAVLLTLIAGCAGGGSNQPSSSAGGGSTAATAGSAGTAGSSGSTGSAGSTGTAGGASQQGETKEEETIDFPTKEIRYIVPVSPGGGMDAIGRMLVKYWEEHLGGAKFVVENIPGAEYNNAVFAMLKEKPDGHQVIMLPGAIINQLIDDQVQYDLNEFGWIGRISSSSLIAVASVKSGIKTLEDLRNKGTTVTAVTGISSGQTVSQLLMAREIGIQVTPVTHPGVSEAVLATIRGDTDWTVGPEVTLVNYIRNGEVVPLFIGGREDRLPEVPEMPTLLELGEPEAHKLMGSHRIVGTNPNTPAPILKALRDSFEKAVNDPRFVEEMKKLNDTPDFLNGEDTAAFVKESLALVEPHADYLRSFR